MKRVWLVGTLIVLGAIAKFGYDYFYFDVNLNAKPSASASPTPSASATPTENPTTPPLPPTKEEVQAALADMSIPVGKVDGKWGERTRQGLCIWRELTGRDINRNLPTLDEQFAVVAQEDLILPKDFVVGLNINRTCQSAVWVKSEDRKNYQITIASTGMPGLETDIGTFKVQWRVDRWYESIAYPDGWMYRPMFFNRGQAVHGSEFDIWVYPYPASHGCVRMLGAFIDQLWASGFGNGSTVRVYGTWTSAVTDPQI
jgi:hypothetical protein